MRYLDICPSVLPPQNDTVLATQVLLGSTHFLHYKEYSVRVRRAQVILTWVIVRRQWPSCDVSALRGEKNDGETVMLMNRVRESDVILQCGCGGVRRVRSVGFKQLKWGEEKAGKEIKRWCITHFSTDPTFLSLILPPCFLLSFVLCNFVSCWYQCVARY